MTNPRLNQIIIASVGAVSICLAGLGLTLTILDVIRVTWTDIAEGENPDWRDLLVVTIDVMATVVFSLLAAAALERSLRRRRIRRMAELAAAILPSRERENVREMHARSIGQVGFGQR